MKRIDKLPDLPETAHARLRLIALGKVLSGESAGVSVSRRGIARRALSADEEVRAEALSARARSMARKLASRGWFDDAHRQMSKGMNPETGDTPLAAMCELLLKGTVSRVDAVAYFVERLDIAPAAAQVYVSTLIAVLTFGRIAALEGGHIHRTPNAGRHNDFNAQTRG